MAVEKSYRGISLRLAVRYLEHLGGERVDGDGSGTGDDGTPVVEGDDWRASLTAAEVAVGPTVTLTEVTVVFDGPEETLSDLVAGFSRKAMRAGG